MRFVFSLYWLALFSFLAIALFDSEGYLLNFSIASLEYSRLDIPKYMVVFTGICNIVGVFIMIMNFSAILKEWTYVYFFSSYVILILTNAYVREQNFEKPVLAFLLLFICRFIEPYLNKKKRIIQYSQNKKLV